MKSLEHYLFLADCIDGDHLSLDQSEAHHAISVLRLKKGDALSATDGFGQVFGARIEEIHKQQVTATIFERNVRPRVPYDIEVYLCLPERDAFESVLGNLTPLGVRNIVPVESCNCRNPWWETKWDNLSERFKTKMAVAMKQCLYPYLPHLGRPVRFAEMCAMIRGQCLVADAEGDSLRPVVERLPDRHVSVVVGPPGGLSPEEVRALESRDAVAVRLAPTRLRTELAATVFCAQLVALWT